MSFSLIFWSPHGLNFGCRQDAGFQQIQPNLVVTWWKSSPVDAGFIPWLMPDSSHPPYLVILYMYTDIYIYTYVLMYIYIYTQYIHTYVYVDVIIHFIMEVEYH